MGNTEGKQHFDTNLKQLLTHDVEESHIAFWGKLWNRDLTLQIISTGFTSQDLKTLRKDQPGNFIKLTRNVVNKLRAVLRKSNINEDFQATRNCLRILSRIIPVAFEDENLSHELFWKEQEPLLREKEELFYTPGRESQSEQPEASQNSIPETSPPQQAQQAQPPPQQQQQSPPPSPQQPPKNISNTKIKLGEIIIDALVDLLFLERFTLPIPKQKFLDILANPLDWKNGVLSAAKNPILASIKSSTKLMVSDRCEVLMCLITCLSSSLYKLTLSTEANNTFYTPTPNPWLKYLVTKKDNRIQALFTSLVFTAVSYDPIGWGIPYNHIWVADPYEQHMERSLHLIGILLEYRTISLTPQAPKEADISEVAIDNQYVDCLSLLSDAEDYALIWNGIITLLNNPLVANNTYLPYSTKLTGVRQEMFIILWHSLLINKGFLEWGLLNNKLMDVSYPIIYYIQEGRKDQPQLGLVQLGLFILFFLSGSREYSVSLNTKLDKRPRIDPKNQNNNFADFLIVTLIKLFWDGHTRLYPLRECCLTIFANISPYIKALSSNTSVHLLKLFDLVTRPNFLYANETNYRYSFFLLETFNNILQYQYTGNSHLVYTIIRNKSLFTKLVRLKIDDPKLNEPQDTTLGIFDSIKDSDPTHPPQQGQPPLSPTVQQQQQQPPQGPQVNVEPREKVTTDIKFQPTAEWLESWQKQLPIMTIIRFLKSVVPKVKTMITNSTDDQTKILSFLENTTMVGILPLPHPIILRKFSPTIHTLNWFHSYMWGVVFLKMLNSGSTLIDTEVKLFIVHIDKPK